MSVYKNENLGKEILKSFGDLGEIVTNNILYENYFMSGAKLKEIKLYIKILNNYLILYQ